MAKTNRPPGRPKGTPKTGGRVKGTPNKATVEVRQLCQRLLDDPDYQDRFKRRLIAGELAAGMEQTVWAYAYGKPKETVELQGEGGGPLTSIAWVVVDPAPHGRRED